MIGYIQLGVCVGTKVTEVLHGPLCEARVEGVAHGVHRVLYW